MFPQGRYYSATNRNAGNAAGDNNNYDDDNESDPSGGVHDMLGMASIARSNWWNTSMVSEIQSCYSIISFDLFLITRLTLALSLCLFFHHTTITRFISNCAFAALTLAMFPHHGPVNARTPTEFSFSRLERNAVRGISTMHPVVNGKQRKRWRKIRNVMVGTPPFRLKILGK